MLGSSCAGYFRNFAAQMFPFSSAVALPSAQLFASRTPKGYYMNTDFRK
jgi:hypothetical protein